MKTLLVILLVFAGLKILARLLLNEKIRKYLPFITNQRKQKIIREEKRLFEISLGIGGLYLAWILFMKIRAAMTSASAEETVETVAASVPSGFHFHWWPLVLTAILIVVAWVLDLRFYDEDKAKKDSKDKNQRWHARWGKMREHLAFSVLWATIIFLVNVVLCTLDVKYWFDLWNYKGQGSWFFYLVMILLTVGGQLFVNSTKAIKFCGFAIFFIGIASWTSVCLKVSAAAPPPAIAESPLPTVPVPAVITPAPGPSSRWSDKETFPLKRCEWSPRISAAKFEADKVPGREVRIDGNDKDIRPWPTSQESFDVESYVQFIQIRSTVVQQMTVYGKPKG